MQVQVAIGANHHFELRRRSGLCDNHTAYITRHEQQFGKCPATPVRAASYCRIR